MSWWPESTFNKIAKVEVGKEYSFKDYFVEKNQTYFSCKN